MTQTIPLVADASVVLNASGNGTVSFGPVNQFQVWKPSSAACQTSTNVKEPVFKLFQGIGTDPAKFIGGSYTGSNDNATISGITLYPGMRLTAQWLSGDVGATGTVTLYGDIEVPGNG